MSLATPVAGGIPEVTLLRLIPPDKPITYEDLVDLVRQEYPGVSEPDVRQALYSILPDINYDVDYGVGSGVEAYVLWHSAKSKSLLDLQTRGTDQYPAVRRDAQITCDPDLQEPEPLGPTGPPAYYRDRWISETRDGSSASAEWMVVGSASKALGYLREEKTDKPCRCGHVRRVARCPNGHVEQVSHLWCGDYLCPTCYSARLMRTKGDVVDRLIGAWGAYAEAGYNLGGIKDLVVSPPQDLAIDAVSSPQKMRRLYKLAYKMVDKIGLVGGVLLFHPWRVRQWAKNRYHAACQRDGFKGGLWDYVRKQNWLSPQVGAIYWAPHFHVQGYGPVGDPNKPGWMKSDDFSRETGGWIYKTMTDDMNRPLVWQPLAGICISQDTLESKIYYVLTHIGILWDQDEKKRPLLNVRWFGLLSSQKLKVDRKKYRVTATCAECSAILHEIQQYDVEYVRETHTWDPVEGTGIDTGEEYELVAIESTFSVSYRGCTGSQVVTRICGEDLADLDAEDPE